MSDVLRVVLMMNPGLGYENSICRGIACYARHFSSWMFLPIWESGAISQAIALNRDFESLRFKKGRSKVRAMTQLFRQLEVSGFIGRLIFPEFVDAITALDLPAVGMDFTDEQLADPRLTGKISEICPDSHKAGRMAAEHLLERGFRRFAFCGHPKDANWSRFRGEGFVERLQEAGFGCDLYEPPNSKTPKQWHREYPNVVTWLESLQKPVGVMACNDVRGRQLIEACAIGRMHVPNDVAVIGVDEDLVLSELSNPPLSSVALNGEHGGYQAAELLHGLMLGKIKEPRRILVEPLWVNVRTSTDVVAIEDRDIAETVRFIRENSRRPIQITDIVKHSGISRRALEIRFYRSLGWSIREEIERVRIGFAKQLLAETNLPVWKIAENAGFSGEDYMGKVFRRATNVTLTQYRREHRKME